MKAQEAKEAGQVIHRQISGIMMLSCKEGVSLVFCFLLIMGQYSICVKHVWYGTSRGRDGIFIFLLTCQTWPWADGVPIKMAGKIIGLPGYWLGTYSNDTHIPFKHNYDVGYSKVRFFLRKYLAQQSFEKLISIYNL